MYDVKEIQGRWTQYFNELYNKPIDQEIETDNILEHAIATRIENIKNLTMKGMKNNKAPGAVNINNELIVNGGQNLHMVICYLTVKI